MDSETSRVTVRSGQTNHSHRHPTASERLCKAGECRLPPQGRRSASEPERLLLVDATSYPRVDWENDPTRRSGRQFGSLHDPNRLNNSEASNQRQDPSGGLDTGAHYRSRHCSCEAEPNVRCGFLIQSAASRLSQEQRAASTRAGRSSLASPGVVPIRPTTAQLAEGPKCGTAIEPLDQSRIILRNFSLVWWSRGESNP